jgi:signal transduction histidine kinase
MIKTSFMSLKAAITGSILLVSSISIVLSTALTTYVHNQDIKRESSHFAKALAEIISFNSVIPLSFDQSVGLNEFLSTLENIEELENIHVYKYNPNNDLVEFFVSYNKTGVLPVTTQINRIKFLTEPRFSDEFIEYSMPVIDDSLNEEIGHVYVRLSLESYKNNLLDLIQINAIIALVILFVALFVSSLLRNRIIVPVRRFVNEIELITKNQQFNRKVTANEFEEIAIIAEAVGELLQKISTQIKRYSMAEQEITELNQNLEEKVVHRTRALRDSNQELLEALEQVHQYQSQVIQSEKMASLGQMVAGVAHEVNTPIGLGITASTMLQDKISVIIEKLNNKTLSAKALGTFLSDSKENTDIIYRNLTRAADLINSFKQVAVDQTAGIIRPIAVKEYLDDVILSLQPTLKKYQHVVDIICEDDLTISTKPGPLSQVIINLVNNAIKHAFRNNPTGHITISVYIKGDQCVIEFSDDGCGIEEKIKQKVFDPFVTTSRGDGGAGLGLHLAYNLVTQALLGSISVNSTIDNGATFIIRFPADLKAAQYE